MKAAEPMQEPPYSVIDVSEWRASHDEAMGSKSKVWLRAPAPDGELWLFKRVRGDAERAEDWSEKVAAELASVFGIPAARVELADARATQAFCTRAASLTGSMTMLTLAVLVANQLDCEARRDPLSTAHADWQIVACHRAGR